MPDGQQVQAHAIPAVVGVTAGNPSIQMRTHLWISWARIALKHEAMAHAARQEMQQPGADQSRLLEQEADAGLVGICAAAFALEALYRELDELGMVPAATLATWKTNRLSDDKQILELLKLAVDPKGLVNSWKRELAWLFGVRGSSVHYRGSFEAPQPHPLGTNVAPSQITYSAEHATRGVDLLLGILERCRDKPKPATRAWSQSMREPSRNSSAAEAKPASEGLPAGPTHCPEAVVWRGSWQAPNGRRYRVKACEGHRPPPMEGSARVPQLVGM